MSEQIDLIQVKPLVDVKIIKESLQRIGIANKKEKILYPSAYLVTEKDVYEDGAEDVFYIAHFKQLFLLMRKNSYNNFSDEDRTRLNAIIFCMKEWKLIEVDETLIESHNKFVFVLPHKDKKEWQIKHKIKLFRKEEVKA